MNRLDRQDSFNFAFILARKVALDLDAGDLSMLSNYVPFLMEMEVELLTIVVRSQIGIERLVKHNLDEHSDFVKVLYRINHGEEEYSSSETK